MRIRKEERHKINDLRFYLKKLEKGEQIKWIVPEQYDIFMGKKKTTSTPTSDRLLTIQNNDKNVL